MFKVLIANNMKSYMLGQSDGIIFKNVSSEDVATFNDLAIKYNKQINIISYDDITETKATSNVEEVIKIDKRKVKKIFITNGKETIKITPDRLLEYKAKGYRTGRK